MGGSQTARFDVLCRLAAETNLSDLPNGRGENILLFLAQTVGRQVVEQRQYRPSRSRKSARKAIPPSDAVASDPDMPEHDLEPPRFARRALEKLLTDWKAVKAMVLTGSGKAGASSSPGAEQSTSQVYEEYAFLVCSSILLSECRDQRDIFVFRPARAEQLYSTSSFIVCW